MNKYQHRQKRNKQKKYMCLPNSPEQSLKSTKIRPCAGKLKIMNITRSYIKDV